MKNFMILHYGFEKPSDEEMAAWQKWFKMIKNKQVDRGGFRGGLKMTESGSEEIPFGKDSITGYTIIKAENIKEAKEIAAECPVVKSNRVFEIHR